jgi:hypothetical protein
LITGLHGLDPAGIGIAVIDLVPGGIEWIALLTVFDDRLDLDDFVCAEVEDLLGTEGCLMAVESAKARSRRRSCNAKASAPALASLRNSRREI